NCGISAQKKETAVNADASAVSLRKNCFRKNRGAVLLFVAVKAVERHYGAEEAVLFAVNASSEEQSVRWPGVCVVAEGERPKPIDGQDGIVGILHEADEFVREAVERGNLAAAEIAYENGVFIPGCEQMPKKDSETDYPGKSCSPVRAYWKRLTGQGGPAAGFRRRDDAPGAREKDCQQAIRSSRRWR